MASPKYPSDYENDYECGWTITNVEYGYESCSYDSLKVSLGYKTLLEGNFWGNLNFAVLLMVIIKIKIRLILYFNKPFNNSSCK